MITEDGGYFFGIGAFETIAVEQGQPLFWEEHFRRLKKALEYFQLENPLDEIMEKSRQALEKEEMKSGRKVLKVTVSEKNVLVTTRENTYGEQDYRRGFLTDYSPVRRNETSPLTYHKTLNYGDCLLEKRLAKKRGIDEPVFLNMKGALAEGACTNLFFVKKGEIITPSVHCGLLPGILRDYVCREYEVKEREIYPEEIGECEEMFLTNSLMGIMPVVSLGETSFSSRKVGEMLLKKYQKDICRIEVK